MCMRSERSEPIWSHKPEMAQAWISKIGLAMNMLVPMSKLNSIHTFPLSNDGVTYMVNQSICVLPYTGERCPAVCSHTINDSK